MTKLESCEKDLATAQQTVVDLESVVSKLKAENNILRSQVFHFVNVRKDFSQLIFFTGLDLDMWQALWNFLKPSPGNVVSAKSAAKVKAE